jgi:hypothetical protein
MMQYPNGNSNVSVPSVTGGQADSDDPFVPSMPSTWPAAPREFDQAFHDRLTRIFRETMLEELRNVVGDILAREGVEQNSALRNRGHVVAVAYMCALDSVSAYAFKSGRRVAKFVRTYFPSDYKLYASRIYPEYRISLVHSWNLFGDVALLPGAQTVRETGAGLEFGILNFADAFERAVEDFLSALESDDKLQARALQRYREVKGEIERPQKRKYGVAVPAAIGFVAGVAATVVAFRMR